MKKSVTLKCKKNDSLNVPLYRIRIYDITDNLIIDNYTNKVGIININFPNYGIYKIHIINSRKVMINCIVVLINKDFPNELLIVNEIKRNSYHSINFILTDKNYKNLPIMKGEIFLWQKST